MAKIEVNSLSHCAVYLNGTSLLGRASEVKLPQIDYRMEEHEGLGIVGSPRFFGDIQAMEATITWTSLYRDVARAAANPTKAARLQVRGSLETHSAQGRLAEVPVVCLMTGIFSSFPELNFKKGEAVKPETRLEVSFYKLTVDGEDLIEIDAIENIFKSEGDDILANWRANLGA